MTPRLAALLSLAVMTGCAHRAPRADAVLSTLPPEARALTKVDGTPVDLAALTASREATVLVFFSTTCPCVRRYQERVETLTRTVDAARAQVLWVSSNADDDRATLEQAVAERKLTTPLLVDWSGALSQALGVRTTPTAVLLDRTGAVRFQGWMDNERQPGEEGREPYLERALAGVLAAKEDFAASAPAFGCTITRALGAPRTAPPPERANAKTCH